MASRTQLVLRLFLSLSLLVVLLAAAEALLWVSGKVEDPEHFEFRRVTRTLQQDVEGRYRTHPIRFYELAPGFRHAAGHLGRDAVGDWPFRGRPVEPSPQRMLRVAVVGDSCVYGASLNVSEMLGTQIADALRDRGWTPDRVTVLSLGVPGYSTVQLDLLLESTLSDWPLDVVVLYPAAWNDQAPALQRPDEELLASFARPDLLDWFRHNTRVVAALLHVLERRPFEEILAAWEAGEPLNGWRVPAERVGPNVARMLARCAEAGAAALVIAPAHPPDTASRHPRTRQDAAAVLEAARAAGVPALDAQALLDDTGLDPAHHFVDYVHPSPEATARLGAATAEAITPLLDARAAERDLPPRGALVESALTITAVQPQQASVLGDTPVTVRLAGWTSREPLPSVIVGGAPLIDLHVVSKDMVEGTLMANGAGRHDLVVQTERGCTWRPGAVTRVTAHLAVDAGPPARLAIASRPGDRARVFVGTGLRATPVWSLRGAFRLDASARPLARDLVIDETGLAAEALPGGVAGTFLVQALVSPAGESPGSGQGSRWTPVFELHLEDEPDAGPSGANSPAGR
ncbi:MAG: SGNH/GDSL hydrolase family protein [Planctomycetota bacterium]|jgi:lysophospholipase L1-like esterase